MQTECGERTGRDQIVPVTLLEWRTRGVQIESGAAWLDRDARSQIVPIDHAVLPLKEVFVKGSAFVVACLRVLLVFGFSVFGCLVDVCCRVWVVTAAPTRRASGRCDRV